tara:strand:- start:202 stop:348 length:147 start_codon:yes stop_codon:yes gene_type:complete
MIILTDMTLVGGKQAIKNAQLSILPGCGHMAHMSLFNLIKISFLHVKI